MQPGAAGLPLDGGDGWSRKHRMEEWMATSVDGWRDVWMDGWMHGAIDGCQEAGDTRGKKKSRIARWGLHLVA